MMGKMSLEKNRGRIWTAAMVFVLLLVVLAAAALRMEKTTVEGEALDFTSERWDVESGKTLGGNSELISDKDADAGENRILYRTKASFDNYKLSFEYRYSGTNREEPWMGCNGLILNDSAFTSVFTTGAALCTVLRDITETGSSLSSTAITRAGIRRAPKTTSTRFTCRAIWRTS